MERARPAYNNRMPCLSEHPTKGRRGAQPPAHPWGVKPPLGRKVTTAEADHCRTLKAIGSAEDSCCALNRLQWVRNGLTLTTADDYNSKVLSERGGAGQRVGYTKTGLRASHNRITQNHNYAS